MIRRTKDSKKEATTRTDVSKRPRDEETKRLGEGEEDTTRELKIFLDQTIFGSKLF